MIVAASVLTSCDPVRDSQDFSPNDYTAEQIGNSVTLKVYKDKECTQEAGPGEGNWVKYSTSPSTIVSIYNIKAGEQNVLATGTDGVFNLAPSRGSSNDQTLYIRTYNSDGKEIVAEKSVNVWVQTELPQEILYLCSDDEEKAWTWDCSTAGACWGNMGNPSWSTPDKIFASGDAKWWGVETPEGLLTQLNHSDTGNATGEESEDAYMVFSNLDGKVHVYNAEGKEIRTGKWSIDMTPTATAVGTLTTDAGSILFPFSINTGGQKPTTFQIAGLDANHLVLMDHGGHTADNPDEHTYWRFKNKSDWQGALHAYSSRAWTWDCTSVEECWGNMGNPSWSTPDKIFKSGDAKWWGVKSPEELLTQLNHSDTGEATGEESADAYMVFDVNGSVKCYDGNGKEIRSGKYEVSMTPSATNVGTMTTTEGAILFPFSINTGGKKPTTFQIAGIDGDRMVLMDHGGHTADNPDEHTFWRFKAK
jgi:hypothetical protein